MAEQVYTTEEAAAHLRLKVHTVRQYLREGKLKGIRIGKDWRIPDSDLQAYIDGLKAARDNAEKSKVELMMKNMTEEEKKRKRDYWCPDLTGGLIIRNKEGVIIAGQEILDRLEKEKAKTEEERTGEKTPGND